MLISGSYDKSIVLWDLRGESDQNPKSHLGTHPITKNSLITCVSDVSISYFHVNTVNMH